ncbi:EF-hand calcium-binding domain-containing protein 4B [Tachyglossus aculeatus]|uniref:EF-hand calcium-binding domain-containing protein 4B n=1 Tax=Tachyglossus aculeatus TaxID=9261 RepID=UPI0018F4107A|nr:EF-hand calcium-binding domain-containing protein 4B [Tachyglossus aculeatus]
MEAPERDSGPRPRGPSGTRGPAATPPWGRTGTQDPGQLAMLTKAQEFFQACDPEGKGFIARRDMQRLHSELPLSLRDLEDVFDALDTDGNGLLTPAEFTSGFSHFFYSQDEDQQASPLLDEKVYQSAGKEEGYEGEEEDEEGQFRLLMDRLGARKVLEDENDVKPLWLQLKKDEPHLLANFEEFLSRVVSQLQEAHEEKDEMESALKKKIAAYDEEIRHLYEEMEQQIQNEKEQFLLKDTELFQTRSQELEHKLAAKELELEQLFQKQKRLEGQCTALNNDKHETTAENSQLRRTNQELAKELDRISAELRCAQLQLHSLQDEACKLHQEKELEVYRVTEALQREKSGLLKQLDFLRERNKHLRDERDMCLQKGQTATATAVAPKAGWKQRSGSVIGTYFPGKGILESQTTEEEEEEEKEAEEGGFLCRRRRSSGSWGTGQDSDPGAHGPGPRALGRIISIEEDPLPQLLDHQPGRPLYQWPEKEEEKEVESSVVGGRGEKAGRGPSSEPTPLSPRGRPVGKETHANDEDAPACLDRLFKIVFVGNSSVGKTSLLRRFCEDRFSPGTAATVGIDYRVKTVSVDNAQVALQLWDTAGQERYRCITQQFFRKADGVIVMYDVTAKQTFTSVRQWLTSVEEAVGGSVPVLLLGNKVDNDQQREVPRALGEQLAKDNGLIFYECSAFSGHNAKESLLHLARVLKEQEDTVTAKTIQIHQAPRNSSCCGRQ